MNGKLVRDNIPDIIRADGGSPVVRELNDEEYSAAIDRKFSEEVAEYVESHELEELADILELIRAAAIAQGSSIEAVETIREQKYQERGGFEGRVFLEGS